MEHTAAAAGAAGEQLAVVDTSLRFLVVIIAAVLLSFGSVLIQRRQLACAAAGETAPGPDVYPIKLTAGAMTVAALAYFYRLARAALGRPQPNEAAERSNRANHTASLLVLLAAVIRLKDLIDLEASAGPAAPAE